MGKIHLIGNAHLDAVWLWRWQEGYSEVLATFRSALDRINEFDDFVFTCAGAMYYEWVEETDPNMFKEIQQRVSEGKWVIVGGQMLQPDCNMPCGESFARHALYAQNYYKQKFGVTATVGYNVDSFGHTAMLPQILKNSGLSSYVFMRPDNNEISLPFDDHCFMWISPDGTEIPAFRIIQSYLSKGFNEVANKAKEHKKISEENGDKPLMCFYGVGNHGGGPTIKNILAIKQLQQQDGGEDYIFSSPNQYFSDINTEELPKYKGDLLHHASGCYSAVTSIKSLNRTSESHLLNAEKAGVLSVLTGCKAKTENLKEAWKTTLFNHFHDIAGGCCIKSAVKDAECFFGKSIYEADAAINRALQAIAWNIDTSKGNPVELDKVNFKLWESKNRGTPITVFNLNSFAVKTPVRLGSLVSRVEDDNGNIIPSQYVRAEMTANMVADMEIKYETEIIAEIPPMGWKVYWAFEEKDSAIINNTCFDCKNIENEYLRINISEAGYVESIYDKKAKRNLCGLIKPIVIDETHCDTWAHGNFVFDNICGEFGNARIVGLEEGDIRKQIRLAYSYNNSELLLDINLYSDIPTVFINTKVKWNEKHKMLKLVFPTEICNADEVASVPFGFSNRKSDGKEQPMQKWVLLKDDEYGLGIATDTRTAYDVKDNAIRLTALRSPVYADHYGNRDEAMEYTEQGEQSFKIALLPVNSDYTALYRLSENLLNPPTALLGTYHKGSLDTTGSMLKIGAENVVATAFKAAEDGNGYILRCHEISGKSVETVIEIAALNIKKTVLFGAQQIRTFRIVDGEFFETDFIETV